MLSILGCGKTTDPVDFEPVWEAGEVTRYDIVADDGAVVGAAAWHVLRSEDRWLLEYIDEKGKTTGEMFLDERLRPVRGWRERGALRAESVYKPDEIILTKIGEDGEKKIETIERPPGAIDNEQGLQTFRALPFAAGLDRMFHNVSAGGGHIPFTVTVEGEEEIRVPAGRFDTWRAKLSFGTTHHEAWYGKQAPHYLVKYHNDPAGKTFLLRSYRQAEGKPDHGQIEPPPLVEPGRKPVAWPLVLSMGLFQVPLMALLPIILGVLIARKWKVSWKLWIAGAVAFVASQVVHLPLNWAIGLLGPPRGVALLPLPAVAVIAGLSAGVCEEVARYVALGVVLRRIRHSWEEAVQYGSGHGGIESMILGALVGINLVAMLVIEYSPGTLGLQGETLQQTLAASDTFWGTAWHLSFAGGIERVFAISAHIGMSVLVMRAIACRKLWWLFAAIGAHTVLDAVAVMAAAKLGPWPTEGLIALVAAMLLGIAFWLRKHPWPQASLDEALAANRSETASNS